MTIGQIVFSKSGRDRGKALIIITIDSEYVYLVDGKWRTLNRPKKKKVKHVQPTLCVVDMTTGGRELQDADIRKYLAAYITGSSKGGNPHCQRMM